MRATPGGLLVANGQANAAFNSDVQGGTYTTLPPCHLHMTKDHSVVA